MDDLITNWLKDLPFYVILAVILYTVLRQNRDTLKEINSVNAVQAENQNGLIAGTNIAINSLERAVQALQSMVSQRFGSDEAHNAELQNLIKINTEAAKTHADAAREQALAVDSISKSFTVALNNLGNRFSDALRENGKESGAVVSNELDVVHKKLDVRLENLSMDTSRLLTREQEDRGILTEYKVAFNMISEAIAKIADSNLINQQEIVRRLLALEESLADVRTRVLELQDIDTKAALELERALKVLTTAKVEDADVPNP